MTWSLLSDQTLWLEVAVILAVSLVSYILLRLVLAAATRRFERAPRQAPRDMARLGADMLAHTNRLLLGIFSLLLGLKMADLPAAWTQQLSHGWFIAVALQLALWLDHAVRWWMHRLTQDVHARNPVTTLVMGIMLRILVWAIMLLSVLGNLGVDITALVAGLGVGGIAVALAIQTLLGDIFASLAIGIDKPFEVGDFVVFGEVAGTIEHIGLKTTRIRSLSGEQVVCANADLLSRIVHNYKRMDTRRVVFRFGITYDTPVPTVRKAATLAKQIIQAQPGTRFDRAHFFAFDEQRLTFEVVYIVLTADYNRYMDIQQEINLSLLEGIQNLGVHFALPVRRVELGTASRDLLARQLQRGADSTPDSSRH